MNGLCNQWRLLVNTEYVLHEYRRLAVQIAMVTLLYVA